MKSNEDANAHESPLESPVDSKTAAAYLNIHPKTLERMARIGEVPATKSGRSWQYLKSLLSAWLKEQMNSNLNKRRHRKNGKEKENEE